MSGAWLGGVQGAQTPAMLFEPPVTCHGGRSRPVNINNNASDVPKRGICGSSPPTFVK